MQQRLIGFSRLSYFQLLSFSLCLAAFVGCDSGPVPKFGRVENAVARVNEPITIALPINNGSGRDVVYDFSSSSTLPNLRNTASITGTPSGGTFRWTPLVSHLGTHQFTFFLNNPRGGIFDQTTVTIEVQPSPNTVPVFLQPGAGSTFDLTRSPDVKFSIEIRDDDSSNVDVRARVAIPVGASIQRVGPKTFEFLWTPTNDQIATKTRWRISLEADDGEHPGVTHDFDVVLRRGDNPLCPGQAPTVELLDPLDGGVVNGDDVYEVRFRASDDQGLRDNPILYWTATRPADESDPDITEFAQVLSTKASESNDWVAQIVGLNLAPNEERELYGILSATDNADAGGTACDLRTDSPLFTFTVVRKVGGGGTKQLCEACVSSRECASGVCVNGSAGGRCIAPCSSDVCASGTCNGASTVEGGNERACGPVDVVCPPSSCVNDSYEPNNTTSTAVAPPANGSMAMICVDDEDYYRINVAPGERIDVTIDNFNNAQGDLDLWLIGEAGNILSSSASIQNRESAGVCVNRTGSIYARVFGYNGAQNGYRFDVQRSAACCVDDGNEPNDALTEPSPMIGNSFSGVICDSNPDFFSYNVPSAGRLRIVLNIQGTADLDLALFNPSMQQAARSQEITNPEILETNVMVGGSYIIQVLGGVGERSTYTGTVEFTAATACTSTGGCARGQVCDAGLCRANACTATSQCPTNHGCPVAGAGPAQQACGLRCTANSACRSFESCKWFSEGRFCAETGTASNGAACTNYRDCGGQRSCLPWPGGYCARAGCTSNNDCESGTYCANVNGVSACMLNCASDPTRCRTSAGYTCGVAADAAGTQRSICMPGAT